MQARNRSIGRPLGSWFSGVRLAGCVAAVMAMAAGGVPMAAEQRPPNIVLFLCDDLGTGDVAALGSRDILTPNIDALFARGTRLTRHWAGSAVCAPSRCVLLTGLHPGHAAIRSNSEVKPEGQRPMPLGTVTLAGLLREGGYATGCFGKWGLGPPGSPSDPIACGFDDFFGYLCQREAHSYHPAHLWDGRTRVPFDDRALADGSLQVARSGVVAASPAPTDADFAAFQGRSYSADAIAERQLAFMRANAERPFFLYVPTTVPHLALQVPADEPSLQHYSRHFGDEPAYLGGRGYVPCRRPLATYAAMVTRMDREVGRIVALLEELGLTDDTILVFTSDNGATAPGTGGLDTARLRSNGDLRGWKGSPYEGGLRVPTVAVWPARIEAGAVFDEPTGFEDWLPTMLEWAGLADRTPPGIDGRSLAGSLSGLGTIPARPLYRELTEQGWQAAVEGSLKVIRRAAGPAGEVTTELYDLDGDPAETRNLAKERPEDRVRLEAILEREHVPDPTWPLPLADHTRPPNVLLVVTDDQSPFILSAYEPTTRLRTPVIDRLASEGMTLDGAYHMGSFAGAVCTPSRHMIMTGRTLWHLPIGPRRPGTEGRRCPTDIVDHVLPAVFDRAGYATMRTCKDGNSYEDANARFAVRHDATKRGGDHEGGSGWHADRVLDFLDHREQATDRRPFLIFLGFSHPHDVRDGTRELLDHYGASNHTDRSSPPPTHPDQPPLPAAWLPRHPFDHGHMSVRDELEVSGVWDRRDPATIRNETGREFACSENIDRQLGRVLDRLAVLGELDRTWIIYTSDHGIAVGRHGLQGKQNLYEHTWRVPLIVKGPGVRPGSRAVGRVYLSDLLPTLCDLCGIAPPPTVEGVSFRPVLEGTAEAVRDVLYGVYCGGGRPGIRAVRSGDWKLVKYESPDGGLHTQLFDLAANPNELLIEHHDEAVRAASGVAPGPEQRNLADDPRHAVRRAEMEALLLHHMEQHDDPFRFSDQPVDRPAWLR
jgi:choline-sulfatase